MNERVVSTTSLLRPQSALALWARALLLVFEKLTSAYKFRIARENHVITYTYTLQCNAMK